MFSMLIFKACVYNFLLDDIISLLLFDIARLGDKVDLGALEATGVKCDKTYW